MKLLLTKMFIMTTEDISKEDLKKYRGFIARVPDFERRYADILNKYHLEQRFPKNQRVPWKTLVNNQFPNTFENSIQGRKDFLWLVNMHKTLTKKQEEKLKTQLAEVKQFHAKPQPKYKRRETPPVPPVKKYEVEFEPIHKEKVEIIQQKLF